MMRTGAGRRRGEELPLVLSKTWMSCEDLNWDKF